MLNPRRRVDVALHAVIIQARIKAVSARKDDDMVGVESGIGKFEVGRICSQLDAGVAVLRERDLSGQATPLCS